MTSGACDSEAAHQFALDHLIPLVEHKQNELVRELHVYEVCVRVCVCVCWQPTLRSKQSTSYSITKRASHRSGLRQCNAIDTEYFVS